MEEFKMLYEKL